MSNIPPPQPGGHTPEMELPADLDFEYSNLVRIAHSPSEMVFDFAHLLPASPAARISSRVIMSPIGAKLFLHALSENLARYEAAFGEIHLPGGATLADNLFHHINPEE